MQIFALKPWNCVVLKHTLLRKAKLYYYCYFTKKCENWTLKIISINYKTLVLHINPQRAWVSSHYIHPPERTFALPNCMHLRPTVLYAAIDMNNSRHFSCPYNFEYQWDLRRKDKIGQHLGNDSWFLWHLTWQWQLIRVHSIHHQRKKNAVVPFLI